MLLSRVYIHLSETLFLILLGVYTKVELLDHCMCAQLLSHIRLLETSWIGACQAPLSMEFSRQEHWSGLAFPTPGNLPDPEIKLMSPVSPESAGRFFTTVPFGKPKCVNLSQSLKSF